MIEDLKTGTPLGYAVISDLNAFHEYADFSAYLSRAFHGWLYLLEGIALFIEHAFTELPQRRLYMETSATVGSQFLGHSLLTVEARLADKYRVANGREDAIICTLSNETWSQRRQQLLRHCFPAAPDPRPG